MTCGSSHGGLHLNARLIVEDWTYHIVGSDDFVDILHSTSPRLTSIFQNISILRPGLHTDLHSDSYR